MEVVLFSTIEPETYGRFLLQCSLWPSISPAFLSSEQSSSSGSGGRLEGAEYRVKNFNKKATYNIWEKDRELLSSRELFDPRILNAKWSRTASSNWCRNITLLFFFFFFKCLFCPFMSQIIWKTGKHPITNGYDSMMFNRKTISAGWVGYETSQSAKTITRTNN